MENIHKLWLDQRNESTTLTYTNFIEKDLVLQKPKLIFSTEVFDCIWKFPHKMRFIGENMEIKKITIGLDVLVVL